MTDLFDTDGDGQPLTRRPRRRRRRGRVVVVLLVSLALVAGAAFLGAGELRNLWNSFQADDYPGPGSGEVQVVVEEGDTGSRIGDRLLESGVVASREAFVNALSAHPGDELQPGTYQLKREMKASEALSLMRSPDGRVSLNIRIREGLWKAEVYDVIKKETGFTAAQLDQAAKSTAVGLPAEAGGDPEGYLYPATYTFNPDATPEQVLAAMVGKYKEEMRTAKVPEAQQRDVLIKASLIQAEASNPDDFPKVARVVENRLADGGPLGFDTTVNFVVQKRGFDLTQSDLAQDSPYNTRKHPGLPPGPINSPGAKAIEAAAKPAEGDWLYFVTVNAETGETVFTSDYQEFLAAKRQWEQWYRANRTSSP